MPGWVHSLLLKYPVIPLRPALWAGAVVGAGAVALAEHHYDAAQLLGIQRLPPARTPARNLPNSLPQPGFGLLQVPASALTQQLQPSAMPTAVKSAVFTKEAMRLAPLPSAPKEPQTAPLPFVLEVETGSAAQQQYMVARANPIGFSPWSSPDSSAGASVTLATGGIPAVGGGTTLQPVPGERPSIAAVQIADEQDGARHPEVATDPQTVADKSNSGAEETASDVLPRVAAQPASAVSTVPASESGDHVSTGQGDFDVKAIVNGTEFGSLVLHSTPGGAVTARLSAVIDLIMPLLSQAEYETLKSSEFADQFVSLSSLQAAGIDARYDPIRQEIALAAK